MVMRRTNRVLAGLFLLLLWLPLLDSVFHFDWTASLNENRRMAEWPGLPKSWHGLQDYAGGLEAYYNDHFGCRKCLVQWHNKLKWSLFREKIAGDVRLLPGKDGWLYYTEGDMVDHYTGELQFTPEQLHDWQVLLEKRRDWLAKRGIKYLFVVAPDKHTIYPEYLPDWIKKVRPQTKLDQFIAYMQEHSTVPVLDVRDVILAAKKNHPVYMRTDTHWNDIGAFVAYQKLVESMARQLPALKLEPLPLASFDLTNQLMPGGDLARSLGLSMTESNAWFLIPKPGLPSFTITQPPAEHPTEPVFSTNALAQGRLVIFHDSFAVNDTYAGTWSPFLGYHFNRITYLWQYNLDTAWIERDKPDIVVTEMVERFFNIDDPEKMLAREALN